MQTYLFINLGKFCSLPQRFTYFISALKLLLASNFIGHLPRAVALDRAQECPHQYITMHHLFATSTSVMISKSRYMTITSRRTINILLHSTF